VQVLDGGSHHVAQHRFAVAKQVLVFRSVQRASHQPENNQNYEGAEGDVFEVSLLSVAWR